MRRNVLIGLACAVILAVLYATDGATHQFAAAHRSAPFDALFKATKLFGRAYFPLMLAPCLLLAGWLRRDPRLMRLARGVLFSALLSGLLVVIAKPIFGRLEEGDATPPVAAVQRAQPPQKSNAALQWLDARWGRFPSGDTAVAFSTFVPIALEYPPTGWILLPLATLVAIQRVYFGVHLASDVFAGAVLAIVVAIFVMRRLHAASTRKA